MSPGRVVIVGAGHGGGTAAAVLRQRGHTGEIVLIGHEPVGPYHRPPLSKKLLTGDLVQPLQPEQFYAEQDIDLRTSTRVVGVDRDAREVELEDGTTLGYDVLILATGAKARPLPVEGTELVHVHELRTLTDARTLEDVLDPGHRLAIVGGGWIGLEVAASARTAGLEVTVLEREERLLARVASPELSARVHGEHEGRGTTILTAAAVTRLVEGARGEVGGVALEDGRVIEADRVLVGVGALADDDLARAAGLRCEDGVVVDERARTEDPAVYAIGDVTRRPVTPHDGLFRLESIPSAVEQARQAAFAILGLDAPTPETPWFWSDQFNLKIQIAGLTGGADGSTVRADPATGRLAVFHTRGERLVAVEAVNAMSDFVAGRRLVGEQALLDLAKLADTSVPLDAVVVLGEPEPEPEPEPEVAPANGAVELPGPGGKPGEPRVTFIQHDGAVHTVEVAAGLSLMDASVRNNLPGIIAECGGMCSCGTCHVHVDAAWADRLEDPEYEEADLLEFLEGRDDSSRLSCQIVLTDELDGLVVRVPEFEG